MSFMLSENGWRKAEKYLCPECWKETNWERPNEPEFDTDDFKDCVVLTKEEANAFFKNEVGDDMTPEERTALGHMVSKCSQVYLDQLYEEYKRIEQAEGKNG